MPCPSDLNSYLSNPTNEYSPDQLMDCVKGNDAVDTVIDQYFGHIENIYNTLDDYNKTQACWKRYQTIKSPPSGWGSIDNSSNSEEYKYCQPWLRPSEKDTPLNQLKSYNDLILAIDNYKAWLNTQTTVQTTFGGESKSNKEIIESQGVNDAIEVTELNSKHKEIKDLRNSLETSLKELRLNSNSNAKDSKLELDANIYVSLLWTTLATGIVYYTFTAL
tara:strand:- start:7609 stop:8265 length:657 start_codon:yes stop_codon:yes gene_type:complete